MTNMFELFVTKKTGFRVTDPSVPVIIRDQRGILFYSAEPLVPKVTKFNMPALGKFFVDSGKIRQMESPVNFPLIRMPQRNVYQGNPMNFQIVFGDNEHKATINFINKTITFDKHIAEFPLPYIYYLLYHEYAHEFFGTTKKVGTPEYAYCEKWCDALAFNYMLIKGFNPSQIKEAQRNTLSERQEFRKQFLEQKIEVTTGLNA